MQQISFGIMSIIFFRLPNIKTLIKFIFFIWGLLICYSRIHVGKHYPLDVFFGAILGLILAYLIHKITKLFLSQKNIIIEINIAINISSQGLAFG